MVLPGDTTSGLEVTPPGDHVYVVAPVAVRVALAPAQMLALLAVTEGTGFTVTVTTACVPQVPLVPTTVYDVVEDGLITIEAAVLPVLQEYVDAPAAVRVVVAPTQMEVEPEILTTGFVFLNT